MVRAVLALSLTLASFGGWPFGGLVQAAAPAVTCITADRSTLPSSVLAEASTSDAVIRQCGLAYTILAPVNLGADGICRTSSYRWQAKPTLHQETLLWARAIGGTCPGIAGNAGAPIGAPWFDVDGRCSVVQTAPAGAACYASPIVPIDPPDFLKLSALLARLSDATSIDDPIFALAPGRSAPFTPQTLAGLRTMLREEPPPTIRPGVGAHSYQVRSTMSYAIRVDQDASGDMHVVSFGAGIR